MCFPVESPMRLTRPNVARLSLPPGKGEAIVFDDALPGFGIRLRAGGKRTWIAQYRLGAKQRRITLGTVETVDPDEARKLARSALAKVQLGGDPQAEKADSRARASVTLGVIADSYLARAQGRLKPRSYEEVERHLKRHWKPLHELAIANVKRANVAKRLGEIAAENGPFASNRSRASLSALFSWAMGEGLAELNPVAGTNRATEEVSRNRVLTEAELAAVWRACGDDDHGRITRLLLLTGQRREEVGGMVWSELHFDRALWSLPPGRTKNGLPHDVPLSDPALDILRGAPRREGREMVFGTGEGSFSGWSKAKAALDARILAAMQEAAKGTATKPKLAPWRLHDLRRTMATVMADRLGVLPHVVEAVLNHVSGHRAGVAGTYNRALYAAEKRNALERWGEHVASLAKDGKQI